MDTPQLSAAAATDVHLNSIAAGGGYLHTSPEFAMKRLLATGSGDIYQVCKVFRDGESGRHHNLEFSLLEWYRVGWDYRRLMGEVAELLGALLHVPGEPEYVTYRAAFERELGVNPLTADVAGLAAAGEAAGVAPLGDTRLDRNGWLDLLAGECVYPRMGRDRLCFVHDFPASQAALARLRAGTPPVAERFEVFFNGLELGNGFTELTDTVEQRGRFECDLAERRARGLAEPPMDERLLAALAAGLPDCAGVAVGVDRVVMLACAASHLSEVIAFPRQRA